MKNTSRYILIAFILHLTSSNYAQEVYDLWENTKPYYIENELKEYEEEAWDTKCVFNVIDPTLTVYKAKGENSGKAVIIIPGGGYGLVAMYHEGYDIAKELSENGITAAVLKYRLPSPKSSDKPHLVPYTDAKRALKLLNELSEKYGVNREQIGIMGFSAGSHLSTVLCLWEVDDPKEKPNFSALIYGVSDLSEENLRWLEESLYYRKLTESEIKKNTLLNLVSKNTPPTFLVHAYNDDVCLIKESTLYAQKLKENSVPVEMHLFQKGGHGFGIGRQEDGTDQWLKLFINWLKRSEF